MVVVFNHNGPQRYHNGTTTTPEITTKGDKYTHKYLLLLYIVPVVGSLGVVVGSLWGTTTTIIIIIINTYICIYTLRCGFLGYGGFSAFYANLIE